MSNKRFSATEISRFLNERLQGNWVIHSSAVHGKPQKPAGDVAHVASQQKLSSARGRLVSHCHLLVDIGQQRAVCRCCGQSYPLMPSGDLDKDLLAREMLSRPLFGGDGQCQL